MALYDVANNICPARHCGRAPPAPATTLEEVVVGGRARKEEDAPTAAAAAAAAAAGSEDWSGSDHGSWGQVDAVVGAAVPPPPRQTVGRCKLKPIETCVESA